MSGHEAASQGFDPSGHGSDPGAVTSAQSVETEGVTAAQSAEG